MQWSDAVHFKNAWCVQSLHKKHQYAGSKQSKKSNLRWFDDETEKRCCIDLRVRFSIRIRPSHCVRFTGTGAAELQGISRLRARHSAHCKSVLEVFVLMRESGAIARACGQNQETPRNRIRV